MRQHAAFDFKPASVGRRAASRVRFAGLRPPLTPCSGQLTYQTTHSEFKRGKKILLAYDGSEPSNKAFDFASDLASRYHAALHVLTVAQVPEFGEDVETEAVIENSRDYHQNLLDRLKQRADRLGIEVNLELAIGHPARQILDYAGQHAVDLIVLGHRGWGAFDRWRLGSVTHRVISYAECAVLVVR